MPILVHSVLFAARAATGEADVAVTSANEASTVRRHARFRDMVWFSTIMGLLDPRVDGAVVVSCRPGTPISIARARVLGVDRAGQASVFSDTRLHALQVKVAERCPHRKLG